MRAVCSFTHSFIHSLIEYLLSSHHTLNTVQCAEDKVVSMTDMVIALKAYGLVG